MGRDRAANGAAGRSEASRGGQDRKSGAKNMMTGTKRRGEEVNLGKYKRKEIQNRICGRKEIKFERN